MWFHSLTHTRKYVCLHICSLVLLPTHYQSLNQSLNQSINQSIKYTHITEYITHPVMACLLYLQLCELYLIQKTTSEMTLVVLLYVLQVDVNLL